MYRLTILTVGVLITVAFIEEFRARWGLSMIVLGDTPRDWSTMEPSRLEADTLFKVKDK